MLEEKEPEAAVRLLVKYIKGGDHWPRDPVSLIWMRRHFGVFFRAHEGDLDLPIVSVAGELLYLVHRCPICGCVVDEGLTQRVDADPTTP
ncbi:MAG: hypothetical protein ACLP7Q_15610 [Isosphaeraceae bacterium]